MYGNSWATRVVSVAIDAGRSFLGVAFYAAYRPTDDCEVCEPSTRRRGRIIVWVAAFMVAALVAFPYYGPISLLMESVAGVKDVKPSYDKANADVTYDPSKTTPEAIAKVITSKTGFKAEVPRANK